ncbi:MAG: dTMP kinase [Clostridiales bacterium]|nr:dTMP kinase [Clostridiales bacterium]MCI7393044.1 dTMP kinase [Clostridiales bacterium]MDD6764059.1 dTMP kinase [Bacillota bacterium]MDD6978885.1 dTMP kinase [Bacillota bacterium]MDY6174065.1 dTMP kinase [Lentihominibacter sp.]
MREGYFISFEGGDGSGKSTQIQILREFLEERGYDVILTREPGGTPISEKIRSIILDKANSEMDDMTEALLYAAARAQLVSQIIRPALEEGKVVICDRFVDSSMAYQAYARGLGDSVKTINAFAVGDCMPDLTILLKVNPQVGSSRIGNRERDRIELASSDFHKKVYEGYLQLEKLYPERIVGIDAADTIENISGIISERIAGLLER